MDHYDAHINEDIILTLITKNHAGELVDQSSPYPTVEIYRMTGISAVLVLASTLMIEHVVGEYQYKWTSPETVGEYKVKYTSLIDGIVFYSYDTITLTGLSDIDNYGGYGV